MVELTEEYWPCNVCKAPVETNPPLRLSLAFDGTWRIDGVGNNQAEIKCRAGHWQDTPGLEWSLRAFLEKTFPDGTWPRQQDPPTHQHEAWMISESASGGHYCQACGAKAEKQEE